MEDGDIAQVKQGVVLLPMTAGRCAVLQPRRRQGAETAPRVYIDIFSGKIAKWSDPKIGAPPGVKLPDQNHGGGPLRFSGTTMSSPVI